MVQIMHNSRENDYSLFCDNCNLEEICENHDFGRGKDLESIDYCENCCPKCEAERERQSVINMAEAMQECY